MAKASTFAVCIGAATLIELATRSRLASIATAVAVLLVGLGIMSRPSHRKTSVAIPVALAVGLAAVSVVRVSPWVTAPALLTAAAALVVAGQDRLTIRRRPSLLVDFIVDAVAVVPWLSGTLSRIAGRVTSRPSGGLAPIVRGLALTALVLVPLTLLLTSADPVFGQLLTESLGGVEGWSHVPIIAMLLPLVALPVAAAHRAGRADPRPATGASAGSMSMVEGAMVLGAVTVVLAAWGATQVLVAAGGADRLLATVDLTAAENARRGFFQLVAVTSLLIVVVLGVDRFVARPTQRDRLRFLALTSLIGIETIGVVIATYARLSLYIQGFGHTMLRLSVAWFLAWLAVVMVLVVVAVNMAGPFATATPGRPEGRSMADRSSSAAAHAGRQRFWGAAFLLAGAWILAFGATNPEAKVAAGNMNRSAEVGGPTLDVDHLVDHLGPDAMPTIVDLMADQPTEVRQEVTIGLCDRGLGDTGVAGWNQSMVRAGDALGHLDCGP
jgi:hypothetical protein